MQPTILLVEDDLTVVFLVSRRLERSGYILRSAPTVAAARQIGDWDIALLDRNLPDGDGLDLCAELRAARPHAYLIMLTGDNRDEAKLEGFARGADDYITKPFNFDELEARIRAGVRIVGLQKQLQELSMTDALTSLRNRRAFDEHLPGALEHARRYDRPLSLAVIDVDHFKSVNDAFGHDAGDAILRGVGTIIASHTRQTDYAARVGGEEFAVLLPETALFEGLQFAEKLRTAIATASIAAGGADRQVTVSIGLASVPHSQVQGAEELYRAADQALYRAKANGRNRVEIERRRNRLPVATPLRSDRRSPPQSAPPTQPRTPEAQCS
jgi:two-component system, cell cycle response regulator